MEGELGKMSNKSSGDFGAAGQCRRLSRANGNIAAAAGRAAAFRALTAILPLQSAAPPFSAR